MFTGMFWQDAYGPLRHGATAVHGDHPRAVPRFGILFVWRSPITPPFQAHQFPTSPHPKSRLPSRSEFPTTLTLLIAMAAPAKMGERRPIAATGISTAL